MSNFNIEFDSKVDILESLPLRMIEVKKQNNGNNRQADYPDWDQLEAQTQPEIGDCYAMMAEYILTIQQPYPGDEQYHPIKPLYEHFNISRNT